ncbi:hypothetical protein JCM11641_001557 [Rhodosporidiobolus odoratus]
MKSFSILPVLATVTSLVSLAAASSSPIIAQYWPAYNTDVQAPSAVPFSYSDIAYYFVTVTTSTGFEIPEGQSTSDITSFVSLAKQAGSKPVFSVGGWSGSVYFSDLTSTADKRQKFANDLESFMNQYGFEGVDIDYEYPNGVGIGCNTRSPQDSANLLSFLQVLRKAIGSDKLITAAVSTAGFLSEDGTTPVADFAPYAKYVDYINLMTYDIGGSWSPTTGPNGPLRTCRSDTSIETSVKLWTSRGFPAKQILLGIPSYAISFTTKSSTLSQVNINDKWTSLLYQDWTSVVPAGAPGDSNAEGVDQCGNKGGGYSGQWQYKQLIESGLLSADGSTGQSGFTRRFDSCSQTPFLFNPDTKHLIAYDDAKSASVKASWALSNGLAGVMIFDTTGFDKSVYEAVRSSLNSRKSRRHLRLEMQH